MGLNDTAWQALFDKYDILDEIQRSGQFVISANQIKEFREPRLMTKFDHKVNLPTVFADNGLAILPITRGDYVISSFSAYKEFEPFFKASPEFNNFLAPSVIAEFDEVNCFSPAFICEPAAVNLSAPLLSITA